MTGRIRAVPAALLLAALAACALPGIPAAAEAPAVPPKLASACRSAIATAAARHGVPPDLLAAIGHVESSDHPFALNVSGRAFFPETYPAAQAIASEALRAGRSVDIGCMQINISRHHRRAFPTLLHALHPEWNADYGARFVRELYERHGSWTAAAANYHSSRRDAQIRYVSQLGRRLSAISMPARENAASDPRASRAREAALSPVVVVRERR